MNKYELERLFHENTKNRNLDKWYRDDAPDSWTEVEYKQYPRSGSVSLPNIHATNQMVDVIQKRKSPAEFTEEPLTARQLAGLLSGAQETHDGENDVQLRAYPSAGARFPLELYISVADVESVDSGLYHVNVAEDVLEKTRDITIQNELAEQSGTTLPESAPVIAIVTAVPDRMRRKYGIRGYRYILFEAGHLMQNLLLCAEAFGFGGRPWCAFIDHKIDEILRIEDKDEETIYLGVFGNPADRVDDNLHK